MGTVIGVFAHVDAGKTTFCEALLYLEGEISKPGRVDHEDTLMDYDETEKRRGITIFSGIASFNHQGRSFYLIDTPGHIDFSSETERALAVLDAAILVISAPDGVQSHTITLFRLLKNRHIPIYLFFNKLDQTDGDVDACLNDVREKLTPDCFYLKTPMQLYSDELFEWLCDRDDKLAEYYIEFGVLPDKKQFLHQLNDLINTGVICFACGGSALRHQGVTELMDILVQTQCERDSTDGNFTARVFKIIFDANGRKITFLKCLTGELHVKDEIEYCGIREKVHEIRAYQGKNYTRRDMAYAGEIIGVTGLTEAMPGMGIGGCPDLPAPVIKPALKAAVICGATPIESAVEALRRLEAGDPLLDVSFEPAVSEINVCIMGKVQLEVLQEVLNERYGLNVDFGPCHVLYKETVAAPVMGYGHYEPLRHYAEVHFRLEPNPHGGIIFDSELHVDRLARQYQNLIRHFILQRDHKGVLTGGSVTDIRFVLTNGAIHLKHTEGGDLREAAWRAVRQGLSKAQSILLEPWYAFDIEVLQTYSGRVLSDITRLHGDFKAPEITPTGIVHIHGKGPAATFMNYPVELLSFTGGTGAISMYFQDYYPCHDAEKVIADSNYNKDSDKENTADSVFCAKGAGFLVKWHEAERYMHLLN